LVQVRGIVAWFVVKNNSGTLTELAQRFHRDVSTLSLAVQNIELKTEEIAIF